MAHALAINTKCLGVFSACQFNTPWASTYIWCFANYGRQQTLPCIIKKRFAQDIYIYSITFYFKWKKYMYPQSRQQKPGNIFGHTKWLCGSLHQKLAAQCFTKYEIFTSFSNVLTEQLLHTHVHQWLKYVGYTTIWSISLYSVNNINFHLFIKIN